MKKMSSEEEQDVFEITDFTTATDWERFIARLEEVFHEWKLPLQKHGTPLKRGEVSSSKWEEKREEVTFATFHFDMVRHYLKRDEKNVELEDHSQDDENEGEPVPCALTDLIATENDFPPKAHCLVRWYGLRDFVVIHPSKSGEAIMTENRNKLLLSSVCIAVNNTNCQIPVFVQLQQMRQKFYLGVCEGGGIRSNFEMIHFHNVLPQYNHLAGLLSIFKSKLAYSIPDAPPINVAIRFTYVLQDWSPYSWPQLPPDIDELGEDITPSDLGKLPFGALEDPVLELHLSTTWPNLTEDVVVDSDIHSDLHPLHAPKWAVRLKTSESPSCSMAEYLKEFIMLCRRRESIDQILGRQITDDDENSQAIVQALDKVAHPMPRVPIHLPALMRYSKTRIPDYCEDSFINEEILIKILQFIFPDSAPTPSGEQESDEWKDSVASTSEIQDNELFAKLQEHMRSFKSAPPSSLTWRLALAMCLVNHSYGGLSAVAQLWQDFLLEMRHRWENNYTLPCLDPGPPDLTCCLLHQKLQMLNCCIQRKKSREWQQTVQNSSWSDQMEVDPDARSISRGSDSNEEDDEFFECDDSPTQKQETDGSKRKNLAEGRLSQLGQLRLLYTNKQLYVPMTQEPAPVTEDLLKEQTDVLVQLGTNPEGAALRAKMQSACLMSDMEAFKAANPGSVLEDFVRWYSPRDWIEEEIIDEESGKKEIKGHLSARMLLPGNMWVEAWENARPIPARRQKRLFDDTKEAEKVLHFLASMRPGEVVSHLLPMIVHCALLQLSKHEECPSSVPAKLEEAAIKAIKIMRYSSPKFDDVLKCLYQAEIILAQLQSLQSKFGLIQRDENGQMRSENSNAENTVEKQMKGAKFQYGKSGESELRKFALDLLDNFEVEVPGGSKGIIGKKIRQLFAEAQRATHLIVDDKPLASSHAYSSSSISPFHHSTVQEFPSPSGREFILRTTVPRPAPYSTPSSQRMYCVLTPDEFRIAGAFSEDTVFQ